MRYALEAAAEHGLRFVVLDRPNPINGIDVDGPVLDEGRESFVGCHALPVRHGMTVGELARMFNQEAKIGAELRVVPVEGWRRRDFFDRTGRMWINPSPNMRSLTQALLYPGIGLLETTNLSVGRGTDTPFEVVGAPWLDGRQLARRLNETGLPGVRFVPLRFTPEASKYAGQVCEGVNILMTDRREYRSVRTGLAMAGRLIELYPDQWQAQAMDRLLSDRRTLEALLAGSSAEQIENAYAEELECFRDRRAEYLLYHD
jgi:uncharacterized protein YbbC (DUF1343 family)